MPPLPSGTVIFPGGASEKQKENKWFPHKPPKCVIEVCHQAQMPVLWIVPIVNII